MKKRILLLLLLCAVLPTSLTGCVRPPRLPWVEVLTVEGEASAHVIYDKPFASRTGMYCEK